MISDDVLCFGNRFTRNGNDLGVAFKNVHCAKDFGYRLAVKLKPSRCRISIVAAHPVVCPLFSFSAILRETECLNTFTLYPLSMDLDSEYFGDLNHSMSDRRAMTD